MFENLIVETGDGVELITINRPEVLNALNIDTVSELREAFDYAREHDEIRVVILKGAGDRAFAAGADIAEMQAETPAEGRSMIANGHALMREMECLPKPVIAAINGYAFGGGFELALSCDIRIAADNAVFAFPEPSLGIIPGYGGTQRLPRVVGPGRALYYCMTEEWIDAAKALEIGLVGKVTEPEALLDEAIAIAGKMMKKSMASQAALKKVVREGMHMPIDEALQLESRVFDELFSSRERVDRMQAFLDKRKR